MLSSVLLLPLALVLVSGMTVPPPASTKAHHAQHSHGTHPPRPTHGTHHGTHPPRPSHGTHPPRPTHEAAVESHGFHYINDIHYLVLRTKSACYVMVLSGMDISDVHSPTGLRQLEVQLLNAVDNTATHTKLDTATMDKRLQHTCRARDTGYVDTFQVN